MRGIARNLVLSAIIAVIFATGAPVAIASCKDIASLKLPNASITSTQSIAAGAFAPGAGVGRGDSAQFRDLPAFCRVEATLKPSSDSDIKMEVWLPVSSWNEKFQVVGNGGWSGSINTNALAAGLRQGYATASTNTGHDGGAGPWMQSLDKLIDFGYRAIHETAAKGKGIVS
jgi:feruloyl esterase